MNANIYWAVKIVKMLRHYRQNSFRILQMCLVGGVRRGIMLRFIVHNWSDTLACWFKIVIPWHYITAINTCFKSLTLTPVIRISVFFRLSLWSSCHLFPHPTSSSQWGLLLQRGFFMYPVWASVFFLHMDSRLSLRKGECISTVLLQ